MTRVTNRATTGIAWFKTLPAKEREVIDLASARQIALRLRLRNHYWLTECQPITQLVVEKLRRKMAVIDPRDAMEDSEVEELLSRDFGFTASQANGATVWTIPELEEAQVDVVASVDAIRAKASAAGRASAAKRAAQAAPAAGAGPATGLVDDF